MNPPLASQLLVGLSIVNLFAIALWLASRSRVVLRRRRRATAPAPPAFEDPVYSSLDGIGSRGEADLAARVARWRKRSESPASARALDEWIVETERAERAGRARSVRP